ncbi:MAG: DUF3850 domain-containing protein [Clostridia bacterium]|nr:DUF3850 domain-containing protein [Clostridia bacterium]
MLHEMKLNPAPFEMIASGKKIYELRLYDEKRRKLAVGDLIRFSMTNDPSRSVTVSVRALHVFDSFQSLYEALPLELCGYREDELTTASYRDMEAYYSPEEQSLYGVVAIEVMLV